MRYLSLLCLTGIVIFLVGWSTLAECPHLCPQCSTDMPYLKTDPDLGIVTGECVSGHCDITPSRMTPWCFDVIGHGIARDIRLPVQVTEPNRSFITSPGVTISVTNGEATVCLSKNFEFPIPIADASGNASVIGIPLGGVEGKACLGACPCSGGSPPSVTIYTPKVKKHHMLDIPVSVSDSDGDLCSVEYDGQLSHGKIVESKVPKIVLLQIVPFCEDHISYESESCEPGLDTIWAVAMDGKGNVGRSLPMGLTLPVNIPPAVEISETSPEIEVRCGDMMTATVTATDPDGDLITLTKVSGPGEFSEERGKGTASGTWSWTASGYPWRLVGFKAADACGGTDTAYLLVHILQPPHVSSGYVRVVKGGSATTSIYVAAPDSEQLNFSFNSPEKGIAAEVVGEEPVREYEDYGQGGRFVQI